MLHFIFKSINNTTRIGVYKLRYDIGSNHMRVCERGGRGGGLGLWHGGHETFVRPAG